MRQFTDLLHCLWCAMGAFVAAMVPGTLVTPIGLLIMGWCAQTKQPWIATDIVRLLLTLGTLLFCRALLVRYRANSDVGICVSV